MNGAHTKYRGVHRDIGDSIGAFDSHDSDNIVLRILKSVLYCVFLWVFNTCNFSVYVAKKQYIAVRRHQPVRYDALALTSLTSKRLHAVRRKILVLDLDETLIHSHHDIAFRADPNGRSTTPDYILKVTIDNQPVRFFVHFRPHVDYFLSVVSEWFDLVVFTASMEIYGSSVADLLDRGRGILQRRYFRQHCTMEYAGYTKDLSAVHSDLSSIFILDNSPTAYRNFSHNAIPIKSWFNDPTDTCLLNLLPVLDALRFTSDVRSILSRNLCRVPPSNPMRSSFPV